MIVESEVIDQSESSVDEDVGRVGLGIDGLTAGVPAEVREVDAVHRLGERRRGRDQAIADRCRRSRGAVLADGPPRAGCSPVRPPRPLNWCLRTLAASVLR